MESGNRAHPWDAEAAPGLNESGCYGADLGYNSIACFWLDIEESASLGYDFRFEGDKPSDFEFIILPKLVNPLKGDDDKIPFVSLK